jgi:DNA polymerase-3 subunit gamma/tau
LSYAPFDGADKKIIVFDECHRLTKDAQNLLLKVVEDSHPYNHFVFCSTQPEDIIKTLRNRCMPMEFKKVPYEVMVKLLCDVCESEGLEPDPDVLDGIIKEADGMPRNALFLLQKMVTAVKPEKGPIEKKMELVRSVFKGNSPEITIDTNI